MIDLTTVFPAKLDHIEYDKLTMVMGFVVLQQIARKDPFDLLNRAYKPYSMKEIKNRIHCFDRDAHSLSPTNIVKRIKDVLLVEYLGFHMGTYHRDARLLSSGNTFWRSRTFGDLPKYLTESDLWAPPSEVVKNPGRANLVQQSTLYTSQDPLTTFAEVRAKEGQNVISILYELNEPALVFGVSKTSNNPGYDEQTFKKINEISRFLHKNLRKNSEDAYVFSGAFLNHFVTRDYLGEDYHGWLYKSVISNYHGFNYCFKPEAIKEKLTPVKAYTASVGKCGKPGQITGLYARVQDGLFEYMADANLAKFDFYELLKENNAKKFNISDSVAMDEPIKTYVSIVRN